mmetsp:Transcript_15232/g.20112  ORF Transcript_15232/g.20112 Transcript_15232/m.20112 type:complete len:357 (+) Transcript_15232:185-1255(+)
MDFQLKILALTFFTFAIFLYPLNHINCHPLKKKNEDDQTMFDFREKFKANLQERLRDGKNEDNFKKKLNNENWRGNLKANLNKKMTKGLEEIYEQENKYSRPQGRSGILVPQDQFVLAAMNIQKTGSTLFNTAFCQEIRRIKQAIAMQSDNYNAETKRLLGKAALWDWKCGGVGGDTSQPKVYCVHHGDFSHLVDCLSRKFGDVVFITMLRDPVQRLISEFNHLNGMVAVNSTHGSWRNFQPAVCKDEGSYVYPLNQEEIDAYIDAKLVLEKKGDTFHRSTEVLGDSNRLALFKAWVALGPANPANNRLTRHLAGPIGCSEDVESSKLFDSRWMLRSASRNLRRYFLFGLQAMTRG